MDFFKVLIVDDHPNIRRILTDILGTLFPTMVIEEAADGRGAMEKIEDLPPNLIFMDIQMPGENGAELTRKIKAKYPQIAVIMLTSFDSPEIREAAYGNGADHFIVKGRSSIDEILTFVESVLLGLGFDKYCNRLDLGMNRGP